MEEDVKTTKEMIEDQIRTCIDGLKYVEQGEEQHARLVGDIQRLTSAYAELEKNEQSKIDQDRRFSEDIRQRDLDRDYKDMLERTKMNLEKEIEEKKIKESRRSGIREGILKFFGIAIPSGLYFLFMSLGFRLEFIEHGGLASFTNKELFKGINRIFKV